MDPALDVPAALERHPAVRAVRLVGSRGAGRGHDFSDWDFLVLTEDFTAVERDLHALVAPLRPLSEQWDPYSHHACYMLMLRGPRKIDLIFPSEKRRWAPAWDPGPDTLEAIERHFWDWIVWLEQKRRGGKDARFEKSFADMFELLLRPMGVAEQPTSVRAAVEAYVAARDVLEQRFGMHLSRDLEREVRPALERG